MTATRGKIHYTIIIVSNKRHVKDIEVKCTIFVVMFMCGNAIFLVCDFFLFFHRAYDDKMNDGNELELKK